VEVMTARSSFCRLLPAGLRYQLGLGVAAEVLLRADRHVEAELVSDQGSDVVEEARRIGPEAGTNLQHQVGPDCASFIAPTRHLLLDPLTLLLF